MRTARPRLARVRPSHPTRRRRLAATVVGATLGAVLALAGVPRTAVADDDSPADEPEAESAEARRERIETLLDRVHWTARSREQTTAALTAMGGEGTVAALVERLAEVTGALRGIERETWLGAAEPTPDEARAGEERIDGLAEAVDRLLEAGARRALGSEDRALLDRAARRLVARAGGKIGPRSLIGRRQGRVDALPEARVCADVLSAIGARGDAVDALARYVLAESDWTRAVPAGRALIMLGGQVAHGALLTARDRFGGFRGPFWVRVGGGEIEPAALRPFPVVSPEEELPGSDADARVRRAEEWLFQRNVPEAIAVLDEAIEGTPDHARARFLRGILHRRRGDAAAARKDIERAAALDSTDANAAIVLAELLTEAGAGNEAFASATRAVEAEPYLAMAWMARADVLKRGGRARDALRDLTRAAELEPRWSIPWRERAELRLLAMRDAAGAERDASRAAHIDPRDGSAWIVLGRALEALGDAEHAIYAYDRAVIASPHDANALSHRGAMLVNLGRFDRAARDLEEAIEHGETAAIWNELGRVHVFQKDLARARQAFDRAIGLDARFVWAYRNRAFVRVQSGDRAGAIADLEAFLRLAGPRHPETPKVRADLEALRRGG